MLIWRKISDDWRTGYHGWPTRYRDGWGHGVCQIPTICLLQGGVQSTAIRKWWTDWLRRADRCLRRQAMGVCADATATQYGIGREAQDAYTISSYQRPPATESGVFANEIVPRIDSPTQRRCPAHHGR
ncbi:MAG: hypothetical protein R2795_09630 [Saprospiraceae bacterium]